MNWPVLAGTSTVLLVRNVKALAAPRVALMRFSRSRAFWSRCGFDAAVFGEGDSSAGTRTAGDRTTARKPASEAVVVRRRCIFMVDCVGLVGKRGTAHDEHAF